MNLRLSARIGAFAALGVALAMAALALQEPARSADDTHAPTLTQAPADPLRARLLRCQQAGEAAGSNPNCLAAWAENRRHFLGLGPAQAAATAAADTDAIAGNTAAPTQED